MSRADEIISLNNIYKVFGNQPDVAMNMLTSGATKNQVFEKTGQVIGVFDASFAVKRGEIFVIMGLSGSGKSTMVRLFNRLIEPTAGQIYLNGREITGLSDKALLDVRRKEMGMVFQSFALMPHMSVLENTAFGLEISGVSEQERHSRAREALSQVGLAGQEHSYPHQLSGGMLQRIMIAMALSCQPKLLIADEPTTALDVTVQAQILRLLRDQARASQMALMLITHDLGVIARMAEQVVVMYAGRVVEYGPTAEVLRNPLHPYTQGLIASRPVPGERRRRLYSIPGQVPDLTALPAFCAFFDRCDRASEICRAGIPPLVGTARQAACFHREKVESFA